MKQSARAMLRIVRPAARRMLLVLARRRRRTATERWIAQSPVMVFAPHPDDETLGCGGTIARKVAAGAKVRVVFMTDGSASHPGIIEPEVLRAIRREEAVRAAATLGLPKDWLTFLDFPDGALASRHESGVAAVEGLLRNYRPRQVFAPYRRDAHRDHDATFRIVHEALAAAGTAAWLFEYPVWLWNHWPWVGLAVPGPAAGKAAGKAYGSALQGGMRTMLGLRLAWEFRLAVRIDGTLAAKRAALECHASQVTPDAGLPGGGSLRTISGGEFMGWMDRPYEIFRPSRVGPRKGRGVRLGRQRSRPAKAPSPE